MERGQRVEGGLSLLQTLQETGIRKCRTSWAKKQSCWFIPPCLCLICFFIIQGFTVKTGRSLLCFDSTADKLTSSFQKLVIQKVHSTIILLMFGADSANALVQFQQPRSHEHTQICEIFPVVVHFFLSRWKCNVLRLTTTEWCQKKTD